MTALPSPWTPLLVGEAQASAFDTVDEIVEWIGESPRSEAFTEAGLATLLIYAGQGGREPFAEELAAERLDHALGLFVDGPPTRRGAGLGLWGGAAGIGWILGHLAAGDEVDETLATIDTLLLERLDVGAWDGSADLASGLVGIGVHALSRLGRDDLPLPRRIAGRVLDHLEERVRARRDSGEGAAGLAALMAHLIAADFEPARARHLLDGATARLRSGAVSATAVGGAGAIDPCVPLALLSAARVTGDGSLAADAIALGVALAGHPVAASGAGDLDIGLRSGTARALHVFNRLWHATGDERFAAAARAWADRLVSVLADIDLDDSLLAGAPGAALALLAAATEVSPAWDRLLLLDC